MLRRERGKREERKDNSEIKRLPYSQDKRPDVAASFLLHADEQMLMVH